MEEFESDSFVRRHAIWLVVIAALIVFGLLLFKGWDKIVNNEIDGMTTITGNFGCLPLKASICFCICAIISVTNIGLVLAEGKLKIYRYADIAVL